METPCFRIIIVETWEKLTNSYVIRINEIVM